MAKANHDTTNDDPWRTAQRLGVRASKFQQRHYVALAAVLRDMRETVPAESEPFRKLETALRTMFAADNPKFKPSRWEDAIYRVRP